MTNGPEDEELFAVETQRLLDEIERRYPMGVLMLQREGRNEGSTMYLMRRWGNTLWNVGAADKLRREARAEHDGLWVVPPDPEEEENP